MAECRVNLLYLQSEKHLLKNGQGCIYTKQYLLITIQFPDRFFSKTFPRVTVQ